MKSSRNKGLFVAQGHIFSVQYLDFILLLPSWTRDKNIPVYKNLKVDFKSWHLADTNLFAVV